MMDIEQMIEKWDEQIALHRRVCDDPLMYTKEERLKNSHYAQAICDVLADLKQVKNLSSNTVLADSMPSQECYKSGEPCKYDCSGLCKESC
jgi:hypothetical protein